MRCQKTLFYGFFLYEPFDVLHPTHRIVICHGEILNHGSCRLSVERTGATSGVVI